MDLLFKVGELGLASRLKRLSERLAKDVSLVYKKLDIDFETRWFPVIYSLKLKQQLNVTQLAKTIGITHTAIIQVTKELERKGYITSVISSHDERNRLIRLSAKGKSISKALEPLWKSVKTANEELLKSSAPGLLDSLNRIEKELDKKSMYERVMLTHDSSFKHDIDIVPYSAKMKKYFKSLNYEWLNEFFSVEKLDEKILAHPRERIINRGGMIYFALIDKKIVGTCAVIKHRDGKYELAKMAVSRQYRGQGIGKMLLDAIIQKMKEMKVKDLYLLTSNKLAVANKLYRSKGFKKLNKNPLKPQNYKRETFVMKCDL